MLPLPSRPWYGALPLLGLLGCGLLTFEVDHSARTTIEGAGVLGEVLDLLSFTGLDEMDVSVSQALADQGVEEGDLQSVRFTTLRLSAEPDLSFLENIEIYVSADGVDEVRVASQDDFPEGRSSVDLVLDDVDLVDAVVAGGMRFRVDATGSAPTEDTEITADVVLTITATAGGACRAAGG